MNHNKTRKISDIDIITQNNEKNTNRRVSVVKLDTYLPQTTSSDTAIVSRSYLEKNYTFNNIKSTNVYYSSKRYVSKHYRPSAKCCGNWILDRFPFFAWIQKYDFKQDFLKDLIAGLTVFKALPITL